MTLKNLTAFIKKEAVLCAALALAAASSFAIPPDAAYVEYIDIRTLAILFSLMCIMAGLQKLGLFKQIAMGLLGKVKSQRSLILILMLLCFFFSMLITNDVALITFVPFTFTVLDLLGEERRHSLVLPVATMQTIAANLGSMLTPIGNPQNLYLYGKAGLSIGAFLALMLPYAALSLLLLSLWSLAQGRNAGSPAQLTAVMKPKGQGSLFLLHGKDRLSLDVYLILFLLSLLTVARMLPWQAAFICVLAAVLLLDRKILLKVDYSLLLTFVGFFVFIGNMGRIEPFRDFLLRVVSGREVWTAIAASQVISNVPAALLLSGFTDQYSPLIIGVNLGGLGTLIASMASLISYKYIALQEPGRKGEYIRLFTLANLAFLAALAAFHLVCLFLL